MRRFSTLDLLGARRWNTALFTTYSLSLAYFEAIVLNALLRDGIDRSVVLADITGVRAALSEHGALQAGRSYQVEPIAVDNGYCFHAKLTALVAKDDAHLVIGSGNLTAGGYGGNLECAEHLHPSFAADAFDDVAGFLEALGTTDTARHAAVELCGSVADELRRLATGAARTGTIRAVSSLEGSIIDQLVGFADELGGARKLTIASPFFDGGLGIDTLGGALRLDCVHVYAHPKGPVASATGIAWPTRAKTPIRAVTVEPFEDDGRPLHAKVFEVVCRRGRLIMSGSANATCAALEHGRNIELSVLRVLRESSIGWRLTPTEPLPVGVASKEDTESQTKIGILRAEMTGDVLKGQVLTGFPAGQAEVFDLTGSGPQRLASTQISADGHFTVATHSLEMEAWQARRLVLRLQSTVDDRIAEGLVHFLDIGAITRRAGPVAARLLALIAGDETPDDVAAVMTWFHDHPEHIQSRIIGGHGGSSEERPETISSVTGLVTARPVVAGHDHGGVSEGAGWRRFMAQVWAAFTKPRSAIPGIHSGGGVLEKEDEDPPPPTDLNKKAKDSICNATEQFDRLFYKLLGEDDGRCDLGAAVQITQYVCECLNLPERQVERYLDRLLAAMVGADIPDSDRIVMAGVVLVATARKQKDVSGPVALRRARRRLLLLGVSIVGGPPDMNLVRGFVQILTPDLDGAALWTSIQHIRTYHEEVAAYWQTLPGAVDKADFPALSSLDVWEELAKATAVDRQGMHYLSCLTTNCPKHHMSLPNADAKALRDIGVARTRNCCMELILLGEKA